MCQSGSASRILCAIVVVFLILFSTPARASLDSLVIDKFDGLDITTSHPDTIQAVARGSQLVISLDCSEPKQVFVRIPVQYTVHNQKMRITLGASSDVSYIGKLERLDNGVPIPRTFEHNYIDYQKGPVFFSLDNKRYQHLTLYFHCTFRNPDITGRVYIDQIEIVPLEFHDDRDFAYILAAVLLLFFLVPGFLACAVFFPEGKKEEFLVWLTPLSIFSFVVLYPLLLLHQKWSSAPAGWSLLAGYTALNLVLIALLAARKRVWVLAANLRKMRFELLAVFIVILCVTALVTKGLELPLDTFNHLHLRNLTYEVFYAHDSIFQYVNGIAIFHDEPFSKYYADGKLVYDVQDRGIVVGVVYAMARGIARPFDTDIAYSSGFYTLFGAGLNVLVLLPVFALHRYFIPGKPRPLLVLLLLSASAFMVSNYIITWYKLAGAGIVISGIVLLLLDRSSVKQWLMAGILWGLATNFHPGLALTYPILTVWLLIRFFRARRYRILPVCAALFALIGPFVVMNLPWSMVKANYYADTNTLFRQHFLGFQSYDQERGIIGTVQDFAGRYTLEQQISKRYHRLIGSLRSEEMESLFAPGLDDNWKDVVQRWNALEASYIAFVLAPFIVLLVVSRLLTRLLPTFAWNEPMIRHRSDFLWLTITQVLTILLVIVGSFGPFDPDINWHIPMSCLVIVLYMLVHGNLAAGKIGAALIVAYALFTYYRLFAQYF